ncbi:MAG: NAD(P)/FAD-dependent oxidoreductase [Chitinophagaceae bacterium]
MSPRQKPSDCTTVYDALREDARVERIDVVIIGAGVTGLASALAASQRGLGVCVLERHARPGLDTSTRNSGVIHAGIYHPVGSLKSTLCVRGRELLYAFCAAHDVPHERCGKLIVATDDRERDILEPLLARGLANHVDDLRIVDRAFIDAREPYVRGVAAIFSPSTGIVDAEAYVRALARAAVDAGAILLPGTRPLAAVTTTDSITVRTERETIVAGQVVNAAGLYADEIAALLGGEPFTIHPCRGEYVSLTPAWRNRVRGLVYPLPHASGHGLGTHVVRTTTGDLALGPTIHYQTRKDDYDGDRLPLEAFVAPAQRLLEGITIADMRIGGSGIRAKLHPPSESFADFLIRRDTHNTRVVHAAGIDSPGLTSSLAIGERVAEILHEVR